MLSLARFKGEDVDVIDNPKDLLLPRKVGL